MNKTLLVPSLLFAFAVGRAFADPLSSVDLIDNAKDHDGKVVVYEGEVIGDIMVRGENAWTNINDGSNAIGVWTKNEISRDISRTGSYRTQGDTLRIEGIFHRSCPEHGGDLDIHAVSWTRLSAGLEKPERPDPHKRDLAFFLMIGALLLGLIRERRAS